MICLLLYLLCLSLMLLLLLMLRVSRLNLKSSVWYFYFSDPRFPCLTSSALRAVLASSHRLGGASHQSLE